jgi:hypothetical protein
MILRENLSERKKISLEILDAFKVINREGTVEFNYFNTLGQQGKTRLRTALKGADGSMWSPDDHRPIVEYANACLLKENKEKNFTFIVEGESDCWVLNHHSYVGIGIPGSENVACLVGKQLNRFNCLYLVQENNIQSKTYPDGTGKFINDLVSVLKNTGYENNLAIAILPDEFEDISNIHIENKNFDSIINEIMLNARML